VALAALATALSACNDDGKGPGNPDAYQGKEGGGSGNECTETFVEQYNAIGFAAKTLQLDLGLTDTQANRQQTLADAQSLKQQATDFKNRYANVACVALLNGSPESIDVNSKMDAAIQVANQVISTMSSLPPNPSTHVTPPVTPPVSNPPTVNPPVTPPTTTPLDCSQQFLTSYNVVAQAAQALVSDGQLSDTPDNRARTRSDAVTMKADAESFKATYPHVTCFAQDNGTETLIDSDAKMDAFIQAADTIISAIDAGGTNPNPAPSSLPQASSSMLQQSTLVPRIQVIGR
jgi:hypothetical protein